MAAAASAMGLGRRAATHDPQLGLHAVPLQRGEDGPGLVVEAAGEPPRGDGDAVRPAGGDLGVEGRDVLVAPVVGQAPDAEPLQHRRALLRRALALVEGHDAPGEAVGGREDVLRRGRDGRQQGQEHEGGGSHASKVPVRRFGVNGGAETCVPRWTGGHAPPTVRSILQGVPMTRTWLPLLSCTLLLAACGGRAPDGSAPAAAADAKEEAPKAVARPFAWPLEQKSLASRGGTSTGAPVTLAPAPSAAWKDLVTMPAGIERDRAAIKAMAGEYRICFAFQEPVPLRPGYH